MYYLRQQTRISGPFSTEQLRSLLHRGRVARSDKISTDKATWIPISECPDIAQRPVVAAQPAPAAEPVVVGDGLEWFYTLGGAEQPAAVTTEALAEMVAAGRIQGGEMVWRQGFEDWKPLESVPEFAAALVVNAPPLPDFPVAVGAPAAALPPTGAFGPDYQTFVGKKTAAGLAALLIGPLGIHKFILGLNTGGMTMVLLCLLLLPIPFLSIVALIEGILYLTKTDEAFYRDYAVTRKQWF